LKKLVAVLVGEDVGTQCQVVARLDEDGTEVLQLLSKLVRLDLRGLPRDHTLERIHRGDASARRLPIASAATVRAISQVAAVAPAAPSQVAAPTEAAAADALRATRSRERLLEPSSFALTTRAASP
jgi:hypothetical protein